jgi:hypothetical protein
MVETRDGWALSTENGASLGAGELVGALASQHDRVIATWGSLAPDQWHVVSRNNEWTVHDTARHMADVMEGMSAQTHDEPWPFALVEFDPNSTPDRWLAQSADDPPARTIERFAAAAPRYRERIGERVAADDSGTALTPYGPAHWTMSIVHGFWDTWLHERDIALPLGLEATSTSSEQRLAALYGLLMAVVPARMSDVDFETVVRLTGPVEVVVAAAHKGGTVTSRDNASTDGALTGDLCSVVDALSGRGAAVSVALPGSPELLGTLGAFLSA